MIIRKCCQNRSIPGAAFNSSTTEYDHSSPDFTRTGHTVVAVFLGLIFILGFINNLMVLLMFLKFKAIRTPINLILLNISVSDFLVCVFGTPFSFAASIEGRWLIGYYGCKWYGFANSLFGIASLISLSVLSYERYVTVINSTKVDLSNYRKAWLCIGGTWFYSLLWTIPPLFGWSNYGPEGPGTTCSVEWTAKSASSISYIVCLFIFCLILPLLLMVYCYGSIVKAIMGVAKMNQTMAQKREHRILIMVICMVTCYLLCWMPYGIVALIATFGSRGLISPTVSIIPSILAKSSTVVNPVIYVLLNKQFYRCFFALLKCGTLSQTTDTNNYKLSTNFLPSRMHCSPLTGTVSRRSERFTENNLKSLSDKHICKLTIVVSYQE
ncbi:pinopsin-like isoform X2 [Protopterus annectens]|uniref:pinopsin-like isoform X2 n=1 Tax=Protopterus annectens TaxID=7888 RepID=UPI001CFA494C|nr:pinopsin-like isoform X2 [Protopterus annectens]